MKKDASTYQFLTLATLGLSVLISHAAIEVTPDHIVSGSATGTLIAIDVPFVPNGTAGGPTWTTGGGIVASAADQGFTTQNNTIRDYRSNDRLWEPDGTPAAEAGSWFTYPGPAPSVSWNFDPATSGIALPDGSTINAIYAVWFGRNNDGITYEFTEGAATGSIVRQQGGAASASDLVLSWTDAASVVRNANFERIFSGPIVVEGGDGFELLGTDNVGNAAHIDAVVIDVTLPSSGPPTLSGVNPDGTGTVSVTTDLVATFSEPITLTGNGTVTLRNLTAGPGSDIVITLPDATRLLADGTELSITPTANLDLNTDYAVQISADAVEDLASEAFAGILDDTTWTFSTTTDGVAPTISVTVPADDASEVTPFSDLVATFDEDLVLTGTGTVTLRNLTLGAGSDVVIFLPDTRVSVSDAVLTIAPSLDLDPSTDYAVRISADAIEDDNGNAFAGIGDDTVWNFTTATPPSGGFEITPDHIVSGSVAGTLLVVDVPFNSSTGSAPVFGGPDWPEDADDGFAAPSAANDGLRGPDGTSNWEPDGTPLAEAQGYFTFGNGPTPSVTWTFDLPNGTVINAVYATWNARGTDGITYQYSEGAASDSVVRQTGGLGPASDLILSWTDDVSTVRNGSFDRIFSGPIVVEGNDGFTLWGTDNVGNAAHVDAIVIEIAGGGNDYNTWAAGFLPDNVVDPDGDFDQDGLTNGVEHAFGLDPTSSASANPFTVPLNAAGTFTYLRRDPELSGLGYTVWTSSDLVDWTEDTGAVQSPGAVVDAVEEVSVTTSAIPVDGKLFVQVRSN